MFAAVWQDVRFGARTLFRSPGFLLVAVVTLALGASPKGVRRLVVTGSMATVLAGLITGIGAALALGRTVQGLLHGVSPWDPAAFAGAALLLALTGFVASWLPARAGTRLDPMVTMRVE